MKVTFDHHEEIAKNIKTFWLQPEKPVRHIAGQFIELRIPHENKDDRGDKRWFTLSSSPSDALLSITTKFSEESSSFKQALAVLRPGTSLHMASPMGDFVLPKDPSIPLLFVAGGIGCTPYHSMIKFLQDTKESRDVTLIYAVSAAEEIAFREDFDKLGNRFEVLIGGRLSAEKILALSSDRDEQYIYLSGPEPMVEALNNDLKKAGFNKKHLRTDFFPGYTNDYS